MKKREKPERVPVTERIPITPRTPISPFSPLSQSTPVIKPKQDPNRVQEALDRFTRYLTALFLFNVLIIIVGTAVVIYLIIPIR